MASPDARRPRGEGARARLHIGERGEPAGGDGYRYATPMSAILGAARSIESVCHDEPGGWTSDPAAGRSRFGATARRQETACVCPRHPDRLPAFRGGRMSCPPCARDLVDAIRVPWPPREARWRG